MFNLLEEREVTNRSTVQVFIDKQFEVDENRLSGGFNFNGS